MFRVGPGGCLYTFGVACCMFRLALHPGVFLSLQECPCRVGHSLFDSAVPRVAFCVARVDILCPVVSDAVLSDHVM
jgi:hypothetical protein